MLGEIEKPITDSVQMYLVKIKRLEEEVNPVPLSVLANSLSISPVSVNEMCRKMQEQNLIDYQPYKGARLTAEGEKAALQVLRRHRLWEVFLVEKLHFSLEEAHELADDLEHATSPELADRLDAYLDHPTVNPAGKKIPTGDGIKKDHTAVPLSTLSIGERGHCVLDNVDESILDYLLNVGIHKGGEIKVIGKTDEMLLLMVGNKYISLGRQISDVLKIYTRGMNNGLVRSQQNIEEGSANMTEENKKMNQQNTIKINQSTLDKLKVGEKGTVVSVGGRGQIKQRMMDMGLVPGSEVTVVRVAPLGDPIEVSLKGYNLSLRKSEAKDILVEN